MQNAKGKKWIKHFRVKLLILYFLKTALFSLAFGILVMPFAVYLSIIVFLMIFVGTIIFRPTWRVSPFEVSNYLNAKFPELEESAALFFRPVQELSLLEKFQVEKINSIFPIENSLKEPLKKIWLSLVLLVIALVVNHFLLFSQPMAKPSSIISSKNRIKEHVLPEITQFNLKIIPPAYTRKAARLQKQFAMKVEAGASVFWSIKTNITVKKLQLIFNDKETIELNKDSEFNKIMNQSGFYQLVLDGKKSDLYPIEVIPDLPVNIKVTQPKPHTTIDIGQVPKINLSVSLSDDYGISDAFISATLSSGKGEGVSFTEKKLTFSTDFRDSKALKLNRVLDLTLLGMKPGDELYFFISAKDNHGQPSRSDVFLVSIVDTTELMSMAGMANGVDLVPEYFRSQRQIIIDTEKLLKLQGTITAEEFKNQSNELGMDQKLLRLRYGKFLGEEAETNAEGDHEHEGAAFGDVKALMDEYAHKHDIAEDATFFEPELKMQLKAVLNEMWSSELRLRTIKPQEALPFEYKALRLLKDLQQKSRVYVAKTTLKATKLKLEKRLSGELDKIIQPVQKSDLENTDQFTEELKLLLSILEQTSFNYGDRELLRAGEKQLIVAAASQPASYLRALKSLRKLSTATEVARKDIDAVQKAILRLLGVETLKPQAKAAAPEVNLYRNYFNHLKNGI